MGKKNRRKEASKGWYGSGTDESDTNVSHTEDRNGNGRSREGKNATLSRPDHEPILGPWAEAVDEAIEGMGVAQRAITNLQRMFTSHIDDIGSVEDTKKRLEKAEEKCREKDRLLQEQSTTIGMLRSMDQEAKASIEEQQSQISKDRDELKLKETKLESRIEVTMAEERHTMQRNFEERVARHDETYQKRMKELEADFARKSDETRTATIALETEKLRALDIAEQQKKKIRAQTDQLDQLKQQNDILNRATNSFKSEKEGLERELGTMKKNFALDTKPVEYFGHKFTEICRQIEDISLKYFHDIGEKDLEVHKDLATVDANFGPVPIDDSDDSRDLRAAHAQRIISRAISEDIWMPFSSELTSQHPVFRSLLSKISDSLDKSSQDRCIANVWTALTVRALQSLQDDTVAPPVLEFKDFTSTGSLRADSVISKVLAILSPLVCSSQTATLRTDLHAVVNSSAEVWNNFQAGGLKITVNPLLDFAHREEWRSQQFDPLLQVDGNGPDQDLASNTQTQVFTLFPRISAQIQENLPPGGWPDSEPTVVHPGVGLPEWSSLVVRGKAEQEAREKFLNEAMVKMRKEMHKRVSEHRGRASRSSISGLQSPSSLWKTGSAIIKGSKTEYE